MRLEIRILDDNEQVVAEYNGDPCQPGQYRAAAGKTVHGKMPKQSENDNNGTYELFGFVYQPQLRVERPNGYRSPVPSPNNGQTPGLWNNILAPPIWGASKAKSSWGPMTPTAAPAPSASNQTQVTRG